MNGIKRYCLITLVLLAAVVSIEPLSTPMALAQQKGKGQGAGTPPVRNDPKFLALFKEAVAPAAKSTVRIQCDGKDVSLGVAVTADGFILTKASDLKGAIGIKTRDGIIIPAKLVGAHEGHDLAMLKVDASGFTPITWTPSSVATVGRWVASCGQDSLPVAVGVVSVASRDVPAPKGNPKGPKTPAPASGYLGVVLDDGPMGPFVTEIVANSAAAKLDIKTADIILKVLDKKVKDYEEFADAIGKLKPGDTVVLKIQRGKDEMELKAVLGTRPGGANNANRADQQNNMGSRLSTRRGGFPTILQHDSVVLPEDCGGPLVDIEGHVVGLNIARAGRVESYAIPTEVIEPLLPDLMSGKLAPKTK